MASKPNLRRAFLLIAVLIGGLASVLTVGLRHLRAPEPPAAPRSHVEDPDPVSRIDGITPVSDQSPHSIPEITMMPQHEVDLADLRREFCDAASRVGEGPEQHKRVEGLIRTLADEVQAQPRLLELVQRWLKDGSLPLLVRRWLCTALGRTTLPQAHETLLGLAEDPHAPGLLRNIAVYSLGQSRHDVPRGPFTMFVDHCEFGYPISEQPVLARLIRLFEAGSGAADGSQVRYPLAHVLSGSIESPHVVTALAQGVSSASDAEMNSILNALTRADPQLMRSAADDIHRLAMHTNCGGILGHCAVILLRMNADDNWGEVQTILSTFVARSDHDNSERASRELAKAVSFLAPAVAGDRELSARFRVLVANLIEEGAESAREEPVLLSAIARTADPDFADSASQRILAVLGRPDTSSRLKWRLLLALRIETLSRDGALQVLDSLSTSGTPRFEERGDEILQAIGSCPHLTVRDLKSWTEKMDSHQGGTSWADSLAHLRAPRSKHAPRGDSSPK